MVSLSFYMQTFPGILKPSRATFPTLPKARPSLGPHAGSRPAQDLAGPGRGPGPVGREGAALPRLRHLRLPGLCTAAGPGPAQGKRSAGRLSRPRTRRNQVDGLQRATGIVRPPPVPAHFQALGPAPLAHPALSLPRPARRGPWRLPVIQIASQHLAFRPAGDPGWEPNERGSGAPGRAGAGDAATSTGS